MGITMSDNKRADMIEALSNKIEELSEKIDDVRLYVENLIGVSNINMEGIQKSVADLSSYVGFCDPKLCGGKEQRDHVHCPSCITGRLKLASSERRVYNDTVRVFICGSCNAVFSLRGECGKFRKVKL